MGLRQFCGDRIISRVRRLLTWINANCLITREFTKQQCGSTAMASHVVRSLSVAIITIGLAGAGWGQNRPPAGPPQVDGKSEYQVACANCHGIDGKGKGPLSTQLTVMPADLTVLAKNNNGVFPLAAVYEVVDGRAENKIVMAHGTRDMPIWGDRYRPGPDAAFYPYAGVYVRTRILAVIDYLNGIQEK